MKTQVVVDKNTKSIICTNFTNGKRHDFRLYKESKIRLAKNIQAQVDTGFQGIQKLHANSVIPQKRTKKKPLSQDDKKRNREISSSRVLVENVIGFIKRFKILADRYRNRRKRFGLRFNLICGICNFDR